MSTPFMPVLAFQLGGTISIPSCFPAPGRITLGKIVDPDGMPQTAVDMLRIEHKLSDRVMIARTIRFDDVRAIYLADDTDNPDWLRDRWLVITDERIGEVYGFLGHVPEQKRGRSKPAPTRPHLMGSVFAPETARVLMEVSVGMTVAESAEYYPPLIRDRDDGHYKLKDCH